MHLGASFSRMMALNATQFLEASPIPMFALRCGALQNTPVEKALASYMGLWILVMVLHRSLSDSGKGHSERRATYLECRM